MKRDELPITHQLIAYLPLCLCINIGFRDHLLFLFLFFLLAYACLPKPVDPIRLSVPILACIIIHTVYYWRPVVQH